MMASSESAVTVIRPSGGENHHRTQLFIVLVAPKRAVIGCLQLLEIYWNLKLLVEILEIACNLVNAPGKFYN